MGSVVKLSTLADRRGEITQISSFCSSVVEHLTILASEFHLLGRFLLE
jgi:hypothetical protein